MPLPGPVRLTLSVVSMCALAVPLAACGAKDASSTSGSTQVRDTSAGAQNAGTTTDPVGAFVDRVHTGLGSAGTAHVVLKASGAMTGDAVGDVEYGPDGPLLRLTAHLPMLGGGRAATLIVVGHKAYVSAPGFTEPGKFFVIDRDTVRSMPSIPGFSGVSPEDVFTAARAAVVGVDDLGSANLAGTSTTHYRVRLDPAKAVQVLGADVPRTRTSAGKTAVDVWLDGSDRIRRISGDLHGTHVDVELSSWGEPVSIEAPPAGDVVQGPIGPMPGGPAVS